jgi:hypothetical protein
MTQPAVALLTLAVMVPAAMWCSLRAAAAVNLDLLPTRSQRRIQWWRAHTGHVYVAGAVLAATTIAFEIT